MANRILLTLFIALAWSSTKAASPPRHVSSSNVYQLLRLKLSLDSFDYDDIAIAFNPTATTTYNNQLDTKYLPGINAPEGLSSLSSDNVQLTVNVLPLPKQSPLMIRLDVEAANSGAFTLQKTELDSIPQVYDIWLIDRFAKDSLNLRTGADYAFNIDKKDSTSFGSGRFVVVIRQNAALGFHLIGFEASNKAGQAQISWATNNEQNNTEFTVERSIDDGKTFYLLDSIASNGSGAYAFYDKNPINGSDKYRLKITDMNGGISYSNVITLSFGNNTTGQVSNKISIYPNPSNGVINLMIKPDDDGNSPNDVQALQTSNITYSYAVAHTSGTASYDIKIVNIKGSIVKTALSTAGNWHENVSDLQPGTYIIQVINNDNKSVVGKSTFIKL